VLSMEKNSSKYLSSAVHNNADLCQTMMSVHGKKTARTPLAFLCLDIPPPYYPNFITLTKAGIDDQLQELKALSVHCGGIFGVKDSFSKLDLTDFGFSRLFDAKWVYRQAGGNAYDLAEGWKRIENTKDLMLWEESWKSCGSPTEYHMFPEALLKIPNISFFGKETDDGFEAGCIGNLSNDCIGLSNIFCRTPSSILFDEAARCAAALDPTKLLVGYDSGEDLQYMYEIGFSSIGELQIWISDAAKF